MASGSKKTRANNSIDMEGVTHTGKDLGAPVNFPKPAKFLTSAANKRITPFDNEQAKMVKALKLDSNSIINSLCQRPNAIISRSAGMQEFKIPTLTAVQSVMVYPEGFDPSYDTEGSIAKIKGNKHFTCLDMIKLLYGLIQSEKEDGRTSTADESFGALLTSRNTVELRLLATKAIFAITFKRKYMRGANINMKLKNMGAKIDAERMYHNQEGTNALLESSAMSERLTVDALPQLFSFVFNELEAINSSFRIELAILFLTPLKYHGQSAIELPSIVPQRMGKVPSVYIMMHLRQFSIFGPEADYYLKVCDAIVDLEDEITASQWTSPAVVDYLYAMGFSDTAFGSLKIPNLYILMLFVSEQKYNGLVIQTNLRAKLPSSFICAKRYFQLMLHAFHEIKLKKLAPLGAQHKGSLADKLPDSSAVTPAEWMNGLKTMETTSNDLTHTVYNMFGIPCPEGANILENEQDRKAFLNYPPTPNELRSWEQFVDMIEGRETPEPMVSAMFSVQQQQSITSPEKPSAPQPAQASIPMEIVSNPMDGESFIQRLLEEQGMSDRVQ